jgi:hypothetical protein
MLMRCLSKLVQKVKIYKCFTQLGRRGADHDVAGGGA